MRFRVPQWGLEVGFRGFSEALFYLYSRDFSPWLVYLGIHALIPFGRKNIVEHLTLEKSLIGQSVRRYAKLDCFCHLFFDLKVIHIYFFFRKIEIIVKCFQCFEIMLQGFRMVLRFRGFSREFQGVL